MTADMACLQVKLRDPYLSALEVVSRLVVIQMHIFTSTFTQSILAFEGPPVDVTGQLVDDGAVTAGFTDISKACDKVIRDGDDWRRQLGNHVT